MRRTRSAVGRGRARLLRLGRDLHGVGSRARRVAHAGAGLRHSAVLVTVQSSLAVTATASSRCLAGKVVLMVVAKNGDTVPMDVQVSTPEGMKTFAGVKPGASASAAYTVRAQLAAGQATMTGTATVGGKAVSATVTAPYTARSCG